MVARAEKIITVLLRLAVGGVFIWAGAVKAMDPARFAADVENFRLLPHPLACAVGVYLPWLEIFCGLALVTGFLRRGATLLLATMLVFFLIALGSAWARGLDTACGCFGPSIGKSRPWISMAFDFALLAALPFTARRSR